MRLRPFALRRAVLRPPREALKGKTQQAIVVKEPVPGVFREAVFFLREDYLREGENRRELLEQARRAAEDYLREHAPQPAELPRWQIPALLLLGMALGFLLGLFLGV
ncbi:MAG: hypothetical protein K6G17_09590 [Oscillospiraceae bacterium]|nr:hypothetical protein [Oscillospiraceae bacterium]